MKSLLVAAFVLIGVGCGDDPVPTAFTGEDRERFLAACTQTAADIDTESSELEPDSDVLSDVCQCAWLRIASAYGPAEFVALDEALAADSDTPLPGEVNSIIADCVGTQI